MASSCILDYATSPRIVTRKYYGWIDSGSGSTSNLVPHASVLPPKPQRCIARLSTWRNRTTVATASSGSSFDLPACSSYSKPPFSNDSLTSSCSRATPSVNDLPASSFSEAPSVLHTDSACSSSVHQVNHEITDDPTVHPSHYTPVARNRMQSAQRNMETFVIRRRSAAPPSYEQLGSLRGQHVEVTMRNAPLNVKGPSCTPWRPASILRHTIAVNQQDTDVSSSSSTQPSQPASPRPPLTSPKSVDSSSTASVDSGQGSGECGAVLSSQQSFSSREEREDYQDSLPRYLKTRKLPGYARMASTMDHALRTASAIFTLLARGDMANSTKHLIAKTTIFVEILESSPCASCLSKKEIDQVCHQLFEVRKTKELKMNRESSAWEEMPTETVVLIRNMLQHILHLFNKIVCKYLAECSHKDRLVEVALEHVIHIDLFGDDLCLETIQEGGVEWLLRLAKHPTTSEKTRRLSLRALAVLCALARGSLQLLSLGGLPLVLSLLFGDSTSSSIEAAGILTQLSNPSYSFVQLSNVEAVIGRLLEILEDCDTAESVLLVVAALSNVSHSATHVLYEKNAVQRLIAAYRKKSCASIFVQEQLATLFSRLAACQYEHSLILQGAIPVLLEMLSLTDVHHSTYCKRIRYKAAICIGTLASTGIGLKALNDLHSYPILCHVLQMESSPSNPFHMICSNIKAKLEAKYTTRVRIQEDKETESAV